MTHDFDLNARLLSNLEYFFERCVVDTTVRQNGFYHVDIVMTSESREVQNVGYLGVEIELNILTDVVHVPDDEVPQGDVLLAKKSPDECIRTYQRLLSVRCGSLAICRTMVFIIWNGVCTAMNQLIIRLFKVAL